MTKVQVDIRDHVARFTAIARDCPREMSTAIQWAASNILRKIKAFTSKGQSPDVPRPVARSPLSTFLRGPRLFGDRLSRTKLFRIVKTGEFSRGVAPMSWAAGIIQNVQDGRALRTSKDIRHTMYYRVTRGGAGRRDLFPVIRANNPAPERPFIPSIADVARRDFPKWVEGALKRIQDKNLRKAGLA